MYKSFCKICELCFQKQDIGKSRHFLILQKVTSPELATFHPIQVWFSSKLFNNIPESFAGSSSICYCIL